MGKTNVARGRFEDITASYVDVLMAKQPKYGDSWRKRSRSPGDNISRKFDRIDEALELHGNIWDALRADPSDTGLIDDIRDLANYCILVHEHACVLGIVEYPVEAVCADISAWDEVYRQLDPQLRLDQAQFTHLLNEGQRRSAMSIYANSARRTRPRTWITETRARNEKLSEPLTRGQLDTIIWAIQENDAPVPSCPGCKHASHHGGDCHVRGDSGICECHIISNTLAEWVEINHVHEVRRLDEALEAAKAANPGSDVVCSGCGEDGVGHGGEPFPCVGAKRVVQLSGHMVLTRPKAGLELR